jgi:Tfp pilus assembly protein PilN
MTQVNLLPADIKIREQVRRTTALVVSAGVAVVAFLFFVFVLQSARLVRVNGNLQRQEGVNSSLNTQIASLARFEELKKTLASRQALLSSLESGEVLWSGVLRDVSMVIPDQVYLTSLSAAIGGQQGAAASPGLSQVGSIQFGGIAADYPTVAKWLTRLEEVTGWVNPWVSSASESGPGGHIGFSGSVDLTSEATVHGAPQ